MEPGIKKQEPVVRRFISGDIGASPWRVKRTDRLPRWNSACNDAKPNAGRTDPGTVIGSHQRHGTDGGESHATPRTEAAARRKRARASLSAPQSKNARRKAARYG